MRGEDAGPNKPSRHVEQVIEDALSVLAAEVEALTRTQPWAEWFSRGGNRARGMAPQVVRRTARRRPEVLASLEGALARRGWVIERLNLPLDAPAYSMKSLGSGGFGALELKTVALGDHLEGNALVGTMTHELIHTLWKDGLVDGPETEAACEAAAYAVGSLFGFEDLNFSSAYVLQWSRTDAAEMLRESASIRAAAKIATAQLREEGLA